MKTTIDIPEQTLAEVLKHTGAKTKKDAILIAVEKYNKLQRLAALNKRVHGKFRNFMTRRDLRLMRETYIATSSQTDSK